MNEAVGFSPDWSTLTGRALGRMLTAIETRAQEAAPYINALQSKTWPGITIGVTGPPGSGKSTLISALVRELRRRCERIGVLAIDPTSHKTGGALLGDRVRMMEHATDADVLIRSLASRGNAGGISPVVSDLSRLLHAAGYSWVLIEAVGAGQAEIDIAGRVDLTLVVQAPGSGDEIQALKKGILEIADLIVVNKCDQPGAAELRRQLGAWAVAPERVVSTCAQSGEGVVELVNAISAIQAASRPPASVGDLRREEVRALALASLSDLVDCRLRDLDISNRSTWEASEQLVASVLKAP